MSKRCEVPALHPVSAPDFLPPAQLQNLQLQRLKAMVRRAYDHVPLFRQRMQERNLDAARRADAGGRDPAAVHREDRPARHLSLRPVRQPDEGHRAPARLQRHHRQAHRRRLHAGGHRRLVECHDAQFRGVRLARGRHHPERLRLRLVHRRTGRALRRGGAGRDGHSHLRRQHRAADHGDEGFRRRRRSAARRAISCT